MSPSRAHVVSCSMGFPRASGDEPVRLMTLMTPTVFSPRERG